MKDELTFLKAALRALDLKYVSSSIVDDNIEVRFTDKLKNYVMHINKKYKLAILEKVESIENGSVSYDEMSLLKEISSIITYTEFEDYEVSYFSKHDDKICSIFGNDIFLERMQISNKRFGDSVLSLTKIARGVDYPTQIIEYNGGLNKFDSRLFDEDWLFDFDDKVNTYSSIDLFLMLSTLSSYFYKISNGTWEGEIIDPFVISHVNEVLINKINESTYSFKDWYKFYDEYFDDKKIEEYLNKRSRGRSKELY